MANANTLGYDSLTHHFVPGAYGDMNDGMIQQQSQQQQQMLHRGEDSRTPEQNTHPVTRGERLVAATVMLGTPLHEGMITLHTPEEMDD